MKTRSQSVPEPIEVQGIFYWDGQEYQYLDDIGLLKYRRDRKVFYALNVPNVEKLTDDEVADWIIIDVLLDKGIRAPWLIRDPQRVVGGCMQPQSYQEYTDNPGKRVWLGWIDVPRYARFSEPGMHNITIKAAFKDMDADEDERLFDAEHGGVTERFEFEIVNDYKPD